MNYPFLIFGIISLVTGFLLSVIINKRRFNRRNQAGLQQYSSYEKSVFVSLIERIGKIVAYVLIALGLFLMVGTYLENARKAKEKESPVTPRR
ncbi:hypothetical protein D3C71_89430 [compost metagenome]